MTTEKHKGMKRGFYWSSKAWYAKTAEFENRISVGMYGSGTTGEFQIRWHSQGRAMVPRIEMFDDAWSLLTEFGDLFQRMTLIDDQNISEQDFVTMLIELGFEDLTPYEYPEDQPAQ